MVDQEVLDRQLKTNMSLDNTSHPGRPEPDELVPSRYALRVGEIDVLVGTHLSFPSVCHVAVAGDVFRWVPAVWEF